ncbi:uncharacterized protein BDZ99DRAFT_494310 [Mytilinidion resinicola]|uniref:Uncharacterized protein n=1 Tax=Mytilinidion resinicola TaxID=574789 RepID=A0A6A6Z5W1_9PEZI|nr:uncharacterized protein BDZ99DRAFT_494310 [Mytilinidion resinicola]KAF2816492.1 hypothetical protein BDZ99DRAFT_494310 [Mytilinidion resinicola]
MARKNKTKKSGKAVDAKKSTKAERKVQKAEERILDEAVKTAKKERRELEDAKLREQFQTEIQQSSRGSNSEEKPDSSRSARKRTKTESKSVPQLSKEEFIEMVERRIAQLENDELDTELVKREPLRRLLSYRDTLRRGRHGNLDSEQASESNGDAPVDNARLSALRQLLDPLHEADNDNDDEDCTDVETLDEKDNEAAFHEGTHGEDSPDGDTHDQDFPMEDPSEHIANQGISRRVSLSIDLDMPPDIAPRRGSQPSTPDTEPEEDPIYRLSLHSEPNAISDTLIKPSDATEDPAEEPADSSPNEEDEGRVQEIRDNSSEAKMSINGSRAIEALKEDLTDETIRKEEEEKRDQEITDSSSKVDVSTESYRAVEDLEEDPIDETIGGEDEVGIQSVEDSPTEGAIDDKPLESSDAAQGLEKEAALKSPGEEIAPAHEEPVEEPSQPADAADTLDVEASEDLLTAKAAPELGPTTDEPSPNTEEYDDDVHSIHGSPSQNDMSTEPSDALDGKEISGDFDNEEKVVEGINHDPSEDDPPIQSSGTINDSEEEIAGEPHDEREAMEGTNHDPSADDMRVESPGAVNETEEETPSEPHNEEEVVEGIKHGLSEDNLPIEFSSVVTDSEEETFGEISSEKEEEVSQEIVEQCSENNLSLQAFDAIWNSEEELNKLPLEEEEGIPDIEGSSSEATFHGDVESEETAGDDQDPNPTYQPMSDNDISPAEYNRRIDEYLKARLFEPREWGST